MMNCPISVRIIHQLEEKLQARLIALQPENHPNINLDRLYRSLLLYISIVVFLLARGNFRLST